LANKGRDKDCEKQRKELLARLANKGRDKDCENQRKQLLAKERAKQQK